MGNTYPSDHLDSKGLPRGMSDEEWNEDGTPKKAAKKAATKKKD